MKENFTPTHHVPVTGSASFPLIMNSGNRMENTHPLKNNAENILAGYQLLWGTGFLCTLVTFRITGFIMIIFQHDKYNFSLPLTLTDIRPLTAEDSMCVCVCARVHAHARGCAHVYVYIYIYIWHGVLSTFTDELHYNNNKKFQSNSVLHSSTTRNMYHLHRPTAKVSHFKKSTSFVIFKIFNSFPCRCSSLMNEKAQFNL